MPNIYPNSHQRKIKTVGGRFTSVYATDKPSRFSKAQHVYSVQHSETGEEVCSVKFQKGKASRRINGAALQDVVAIAHDRAVQLLGGGYASPKLRIAAEKLEEVLLILQARK